MTVEEINAAMVALVDGADGRDLTDQEIAQYEQYERDLTEARDEAGRRTSSASIRARHARYQAVDPPLHPGGAGDDGASSEEYRHLWDRYLRADKGAIAEVESMPRNAQSEGVGSEGGFLVPPGFRARLIERLKAFGGIAGVAEEIVTETGNGIEWPTIDDTGNVGEVVAEGGTFSAGADLVFGSNNLGAFRYMAGGGSGNPVRVSVELLQDAAFDVEALVARLLGVRLARVQAVHLATGTGVNQPLGLITGLTGIELLADTNGITYDDLVNFTHAVDPAYRALLNCRWVFNDTMLGTIQKVKDSHGDPIWSRLGPNFTDPLPNGYLLGYPITIDQAMPTMVANDNTLNWGAFGDIREGYVVRRVRDVQIIVNPWTRASNGQVEYTAWMRMDATQQNTAAYAALTGEA